MDSLKRVFSYTSTTRNKIISAVILTTLSVCFGIVPYYLIFGIMDRFMTKSQTFDFVFLSALGVFICLVLRALAFSKATSLAHENAFDILMGMRKKMAAKLMRMPMGEINKMMHGSYKMLFVEDVESMEQALAHIIPEGISNLLAAILVTLILFALDWRMAFLVIATIPVGYIFFIFMMKDYSAKVKEFSNAAKKVNSVSVEYINGMDVIKIFNQTTTSFAKYQDAVSEQRDYTLNWFKYCWPFQAAYYSIMPFNIMFALPVGTFFLVNGSIEFPVYMLCLLLGLSYSAPIVKLTEFLNMIPTVTEKEKKVYDLFQMPELSNGTDEKVVLTDNTIEFKNVSFKYDTTDVLKNINFTLKENTVTALVGASGSGKSTTAKLLMRFWDIEKGSILLGGLNIKNMKLQDLMDKISYVSQDVFLFNTSIKENILMGKPNASFEEIVKASKMARCHDFIMTLPNGYDTMSGEAGTKLSGGERQRISIARALLKDAPVIILDEATSATDPENEYLIQTSINSLTEGKTLLVIAHRLSTIVDADKILVFNEGEIKQSGTHEELLDQCKLYNEMWSAHMKALSWDLNNKRGEAS